LDGFFRTTDAGLVLPTQEPDPLGRERKLFKDGFERLAQVRGYSDDQFRALEHPLIQLEPILDELDNLLLTFGVLPE
jgi:hypothetical protein